MKTKFLALLATFLLVSVGANAATISAAGYYTSSGDVSNVPLGNVDLESRALSPNIFYNSYAGAASENFTTLDITMGGIVENSGTTFMGSYTQPTGINSGENYIAMVLGGQSVFTLGSGVNEFSFLWGSISTYNNVTVTNMNNDQYTITGNDMLLSLGYTSAQIAAMDNTIAGYLSITDFAGIKSVVLAATAVTFEAGRFAISAVPLPGALALFGTGLAGLIFRRKSAIISA